MTAIDTALWERSSDENWGSPTSTSLKMLKNLNHDYIVSDTQFANYTLSSDVTTLQGDDDGLGVVFDYLDNKNYKYIMYQGGGLGNLYGTTKPSVVLVEVLNGTHITLLRNESFPYWKINSKFSIKLENVFDDIIFYVNDVEALKYSKDNAISGKIGFVTYSQVCDFNNIQMYQSPANRLKTKYVLYAVESDETFVEIEVRQKDTSTIATEVLPRVAREESVDTEIFAIYSGNSNVLTEIQPIGFYVLDAEIDVRPHNKMMALYEVQQPPVITSIFNPTQDSFTREKSEFSTINYGGTSSMVAGLSNDDIWRSYIQFDLSFVNPSYVLVDTKLRLYYRNTMPSNIQLEILNADEAWNEYNITNLNRPRPIKLISNEFTVHNGYIEFDVNDIVKDWIALRTENNGFILRVANETELGQAIFHTRESILPPELVVSYYDSRIFSQGRSQIITEMFIYNRRNSDKVTEVTVDSAYSFTAKDTEIYVHRREVPLDSEIFTEIEISKPYVPTEFIVTIHVDNDIATEIGSRLGNENKTNAEIVVTKRHVDTEIYIKHNDSIPVEIKPRAITGDEVSTEVAISREFIFVEIVASVPESSDILTELSVNREVVLAEISVPFYDDNDVLTEIEINSTFSSKKLVEILVSKETVKSEVSVRIGRLKDLYAQVSVSRPKVEVEVGVKYRSDIWIEIEPNIKSDVFTEIRVNKPLVEVEISVFGYERNDKNTEIYVSNLSEIKTEIFANKISQVEAEIDAKPVSQTKAQITVNKPKAQTEIVIPTWADLDIYAEIQPRILMVNNVYTLLQVGSFGGAYAFII